jgi:prepilin-type N-terminal cleavage/methylation domain-containing protein
MPHDIDATRHARGFTLIELVAAIVIVGVVAAVAMPLYRSWRYDARVAAMRGIEESIAANQRAAMSAWRTRGSAGPMTCGGAATESVVVGDRVISVWDATDGSIAGAPTACGMWVMLGCGTHAQAVAAGPIPCEALPGYHIYRQTEEVVVLFPAGNVSPWDSNCLLAYAPAAGYKWPLWVGDRYVSERIGISFWYLPAGYVGDGVIAPTGWTPAAGTTCSD